MSNIFFSSVFAVTKREYTCVRSHAHSPKNISVIIKKSVFTLTQRIQRESTVSFRDRTRRIDESRVTRILLANAGTPEP